MAGAHPRSPADDARDAHDRGADVMTDTPVEVVEQTIRIQAHPETVWRYWTDPQRMADWWGQAQLDPRPGGTYRVQMVGGAVMLGEFVELVPYERIVFSFGWEPHEDMPSLAPGSTRVEVILADDGGDTVLTVRHTGLPPALVADHDGGWRHFLPILADAASHGTA
jgi:uncharacterized protein YndB with AHSA1/START domain